MLRLIEVAWLLSRLMRKAIEPLGQPVLMYWDLLIGWRMDALFGCLALPITVVTPFLDPQYEEAAEDGVL